MLSFIQGNQRNGIRTTVKVLVDKFEGKPCGWYLMAVLCNLAKLCAQGKVEVLDDSTLLDDAELEAALKNTAGMSISSSNPRWNSAPPRFVP